MAKVDLSKVVDYVPQTPDLSGWPMYKTKWITADNREVTIKAMADSHLIHTFNMLIRSAKRALNETIDVGRNFMSSLQGEMAIMSVEADIAFLTRVDIMEYAEQKFPPWGCMFVEIEQRGLVGLIEDWLEQGMKEELQTNRTNKQICGWEEKEDSDENIWQTECGNTWLASERNREDTNLFNCPYCGGEIAGALGLYIKRFHHKNFWNRKDRFNRVPPELIK